jgi:hypothetical protein
MIAAIYVPQVHRAVPGPLRTRSPRDPGHEGWTVAEAHVYDDDDGISGAEFAKRLGLVRLINALTPRPPFQGRRRREKACSGTRDASAMAAAIPDRGHRPLQRRRYADGG